MFSSTRIVAGPLVATLIGVALSITAQAGTPDRIYHFGDDPDEGASLGATPNALNLGLTLDSQFFDPSFSDATDLSHNSGPTYFNASSRPGAASGNFGLQFDGSDYLIRTGAAADSPSLGVPAQGDDKYIVAGGAPGYDGITTRYIEAWVRPTGGAGTRRDIVNDSARFSIFIGADNNWGFVNGTTTVNSSTPAALNAWTHVMHRTFGSGGGAVLLVDGIAVAATPNGYPTGGQAGNALNFVVGAGGGGLDPAQLTNFFQGEMDELIVGVAGNNTGQPGGRDFGPVNLAQDNDFIRQELSGVNPGDINRDGSVNSTDVNTFITNWRRAQQLNGVTVGDLNSRAFGDLNMNGVVDIDDAYTLHAALRAGGGAGLDFALLGAAVPEPGSVLLLISGLSMIALSRKRDR